MCLLLSVVPELFNVVPKEADGHANITGKMLKDLSLFCYSKLSI